jgi:hypothetical protein
VTLKLADAHMAPVAPPADWFNDPSLDGPTPLTVTRDGRVYGHAALWDSCHLSFANRCVTPPRSRSGYSHFHVGALESAEGDLLHIGRITLATGHASTAAGVSEADARAHYDDTGTVAAFVRAGEDRHGIWVAGALRSDLPVEKRRDLLANPPSGDWRNGELIAIHAVPTPGYAVPRVAVAASAAIFSTGLTPVGPENEAQQVIDALAASVLPPPRRYALPGHGR